MAWQFVHEMVRSLICVRSATSLWMLEAAIRFSSNRGGRFFVLVPLGLHKQQKKNPFICAIPEEIGWKMALRVAC